jgi:nucleotide-binding universal stress UspA family protein
MKDELKAWCQTTHAECLAQIAVFKPDGRDALRQDQSVREALEAVAESGLTKEAQQHAESALLALSDTELVQTEGQKHVMLSCECITAAAHVIVLLSVHHSFLWHAVLGCLTHSLNSAASLSRVHVMQTNGMCKLLFNESTSR